MSRNCDDQVIHAYKFALAAVVGMLVEVPVMLLMAWVVNARESWYDAGIRT